MTTFIAIASGKGGVGKTSLAVNLGVSLANFGHDVVVVDANLSTPHLSLHFGSPKLQNTLHDVLQGKMNIRDAAYLHPSGVKIIPGDLSLKAYDSLRDRHFESLAHVLVDLVGTTDFVILDTAAGMGKEVVHALKNADQVLVVTNNDLPSLSDALKTIRKAEQFGKHVRGIVVNRTRGGESATSIEAMLEKPIIGMIPDDKHMRKALDVRHPVVHSYPDTPSAIAMKKVAAALLGQTYEHTLEKEEKKGLFTYMLERLGLR